MKYPINNPFTALLLVAVLACEGKNDKNNNPDGDRGAENQQVMPDLSGFEEAMDGSLQTSTLVTTLPTLSGEADLEECSDATAGRIYFIQDDETSFSNAAHGIHLEDKHTKLRA